MFQEFEIIVVTVEKSLLRMSYENQNPLQARRFQTQSCHTLNVWVRHIEFGNFQQTSKKSEPNNSHGSS